RLEIDLDHAVALSGAIAESVNRRRLQRIGNDGAELRGRKRQPIDFGDLSPIATTARHDRAGVLLRSHHPIWISTVGGELLTLIDRNLVVAAATLSAVERDRGALIEAKEHPLAVCRIDPTDVGILASGSAFECAERLAAVHRSIDRR